MNTETLHTVASVLGPDMNVNFSIEPEITWLSEAIEKYGEHGLIYKESQSGSNYYRYKVWLLHLEGHVKIRIMDWRFDSIDDVIKVKKEYHDKVMELVRKLKEFDKMN